MKFLSIFNDKKSKIFLSMIIILVVTIFYLLKETYTEIIVIKQPTELYIEPMELVEDNVISILKPGTLAKLTATRISKNFMYYKIRLEDGVEGYVRWFSDNLKFIDFKKKDPK